MPLDGQYDEIIVQQRPRRPQSSAMGPEALQSAENGLILPVWGVSPRPDAKASSSASRSVTPPMPANGDRPATVFERLSQRGTASSSRRTQEQRLARQAAEGSAAAPKRGKGARKPRRKPKRPVAESEGSVGLCLGAGEWPGTAQGGGAGLLPPIPAAAAVPAAGGRTPKSFRVASLGIAPGIPAVLAEEDEDEAGASDDDSGVAGTRTRTGPATSEAGTQAERVAPGATPSHAAAGAGGGSLPLGRDPQRRARSPGNGSSASLARPAASHHPPSGRRAGKASSPRRVGAPASASAPVRPAPAGSISLGEPWAFRRSSAPAGSAVSGSVGRGGAALPLSPSRSLGQVSVSRLDAARLTPLAEELSPGRARRPSADRRAGGDAAASSLPVTVGAARAERRRAEARAELLRARVRKLEQERRGAERRASLMATHERAVVAKGGGTDGLQLAAEAEREAERRRVARLRRRNAAWAAEAAERRAAAEEARRRAAAEAAERMRGETAAGERLLAAQRAVEAHTRRAEAAVARRRLRDAAGRRAGQEERRRLARRDDYEMAIVAELSAQQSADQDFFVLAEREARAIERLRAAQMREMAALTSLSERSGAHWRRLRRQNGLRADGSEPAGERCRPGPEGERAERVRDAEEHARDAEERVRDRVEGGEDTGDDDDGWRMDADESGPDAIEW